MKDFKRANIIELEDEFFLSAMYVYDGDEVKFAGNKIETGDYLQLNYQSETKVMIYIDNPAYSTSPKFSISIKELEVLRKSLTLVGYRRENTDHPLSASKLKNQGEDLMHLLAYD